MNFAQMLAATPAFTKTTALRKPRDFSKQRAAYKAKTRQWFKDNLGDGTWTTYQIACKRGQTSATCLPLLYDLEREGFLVRAGYVMTDKRGPKPVLWRIA